MLDPADFPNAIAFAFEAVGGIGAAAKVCERSYRRSTNGAWLPAFHAPITPVKPTTRNS